MNVIIIGKRSNLSKILYKTFSNEKKFKTFVIKTDQIKKINSKIFNNATIIINSFHPSYKKNEVILSSYIKKNLNSLLSIFKKIKNIKIKKIIYSSSSSVYIFNENGNLNNNHPYLYESCKLFCENLIKTYCLKNKKKFVIARIFNLYGGYDKASLISKIKKSKNKNKFFFLNNKGESVRDYIHVRDVAEIYKYLSTNDLQGIFQIGSGRGLKTKKIFNLFNVPKKNLRFKRQIELKTSIANINNLKKKIKFKKFTKIETFIKDSLI